MTQAFRKSCQRLWRAWVAVAGGNVEKSKSRNVEMGGLGLSPSAMVAGVGMHRNPSRKRWLRQSSNMGDVAISGRCFASSVALATPCGVGSD
ncbi:hypothetical protein B7486_01220 [cyanobacterium TDX16]|nr:hypothetical protein B7486_01220 [cyanobacterium TDX16]